METKEKLRKIVGVLAIVFGIAAVTYTTFFVHGLGVINDRFHGASAFYWVITFLCTAAYGISHIKDL